MKIKLLLLSIWLIIQGCNVGYVGKCFVHRSKTRSIQLCFTDTESYTLSVYDATLKMKIEEKYNVHLDTIFLQSSFVIDTLLVKHRTLQILSENYRGTELVTGKNHLGM